MAKKTKLVVLTTETENELQVNDKSYGWLQRVGRRLYSFCQCVRKKNPMPEEKCHDLAAIGHDKIYANGYGVTLRLYVKHTCYTNQRELADIIMHRTADLCAKLR